MPKPDKPDERSQADKFRELARELGCDEDEAKFDEALKRIAKAPQKPKAPHEPKGEKG